MNKKEQKIELDRCLNGCTIDGKKLSGMHYFYLRYWSIGGILPRYSQRDSHFFDIWMNSFNKTNDFKPLRVFWPMRYR